jgi:asparagine synthetase B (glutamine-hydrolysing)
MPGIFGLFSDQELIGESESIFSRMADRLSHRGNLRQFSYDLVHGKVLIGLLSNDASYVENQDHFRLLAIDQTIDDSGNIDQVAACLQELKCGVEISNIPQMLAAVGVTDKELRILRSLDGVKPLYFAKMQNSLAFSSSKKPIWNIAPLTPEILDPGHVLRMSEADGIELIRVHTRSRPLVKYDLDKESHLASLSKLLRQSFSRIKQTSRCGVLFSGGVDSSLAALLSKEVKQDTLLISVATPESKDSKKTRVAASVLSPRSHLCNRVKQSNGY